MKWTTETGETRYLAVHALPAWGGGSQCDPADIICALKANPEACAEVMRALAPLTMANANADRARAEKAERERDEARAERDMPCAHLAEERRLESELDALKAKLAEAERSFAGYNAKLHAEALRENDALRSRLAKTERVVEAARGAWKAALAGDPIGPKWAALGQALDALDALRAIDSPVVVAATACDHKRQRCENDHAVCRDCGAVNRAVTGVVDWGPPETAREDGSRAGDDCGCRCHADPPPDYLTRAELVAAVRSAASAVGGPPRRALDALADALEIPRT